MYLLEGETLTMEELLYGLMLPSATTRRSASPPTAAGAAAARSLSDG